VTAAEEGGRRRRDREAVAEARRRGRAVRELLVEGADARAVARRHRVRVSELRGWAEEFVRAGRAALTPAEEPEQRWRRGGPGRRPKGRGARTLLSSLHVRVTKTLKARLEADARRRSREEGRDVSVPEVVREILADHFERG